ncbi:hypothetical protein B7463_g11440, partial [Scytalidium lignicola]
MARILDASQEGRIALAINALKNGQIKSIRSAARNFDVPRNTLNVRFHGRVQKGTTYTKSFKLTQFEEESLVQWIISMGKRGMPPRPSQVHSMANSLISKRGEPTPPSLIGKNWIQRFLSRYAELTTKYIRKYSYQRAKCEDSKLIQQWFNQFLEIKAQYGILDEDIYNFDETGFAIGTITTTKVTVIESINASGWALPPLIIFKGKHHQLALTNLLPEGWRDERSNNEWTDNRIGLEWLEKTFEPATKDKIKGQYRMLVLDGYSNYVAPEFDLFYSAHKIIPICMPPHSSHLLQPLDVTCFSVLKRMYGTQIENKMQGRIQHIDKEDFLELYPITIQQLLREQNNPPTPTKTALKQLVKGCELAMHNAVFLAKEIEELKAVNASMQRKLRRSRKQLVYTGSLTRQEAQELAQSSATVQNVIQVTNSSISTDALPAPLRRPPTCSGFKYLVLKVEVEGKWPGRWGGPVDEDLR